MDKGQTVFVAWCLLITFAVVMRVEPSLTAETTPEVSLRRLIDANQLADARLRLSEIAAQRGFDAKLLLYEGMILYREGCHQDSIVRLEKSLALDQSVADVHKLMGLNLVKLNRQRLAAPYFQRAVELAPHDAMARYYLGLWLLNQRLFKEAKREFAEVVRLNPRYVDAYCMLGVVHEELQLRPEARRWYERALQVSRRVAPNYEKPSLYLGRFLAADSQFEASLDYLRTAITAKPDFLDAWLELGRSLQALRMRDEAAAAYREVARLDPKNREARYRLMRLYRELGLRDRADHELDLFRDLERTKPENSGSGTF